MSEIKQKTQLNTAAEKKPQQGVPSSDVIKTAPQPQVSLLEQLGNWTIPIISLMVLAIVSFIVLIPSAEDTMSTLDEIREAEKESDKYKQKLNALKAISVSEVNSSLQVASEVIKDDLQVAELANDVEALARVNDLETKSVSFTSSQSSSIDVPSFVRVISGPFSYSGRFKDLTGFIYDLREKSSTAVSIREIYINRSGKIGTEEESMWSANFVIDAFTTKKVTSVSPDDSISSDIDESVMNEIRERLGSSGDESENNVSENED